MGWGGDGWYVKVKQGAVFVREQVVERIEKLRPERTIIQGFLVFFDLPDFARISLIDERMPSGLMKVDSCFKILQHLG